MPEPALRIIDATTEAGMQETLALMCAIRSGAMVSYEENLRQEEEGKRLLEFTRVTPVW